MMADDTPASALGPLPQTAAAPGLQEPSTSSTNGSSNPSHMPPPPLPPVVIPQNNNPIPTAVTSPFSNSATGLMTPSSAGGSVRRAAPEPNKRALYVGGLDPKVGEDLLRQIFETAGHVVSVKIIPDKNFQNKGANYGFIEYDDPGSADAAMAQLNNRKVLNSEIRVNWAYQSNNTAREDTSNHFHIFVGDLSNEVNDEVLLQAFSAFGTVSEARVMWDMKTGRSRGYGFVAFRDRGDAEKALSSMDGEWLGSRAIRCNWANQKGQPSISQQQALVSMGMSPANSFGGHHQYPTQGIQSYDMVFAQTPAWQTTVYVGNLTPYTTQNDVVPLFQNFGFVSEARFQADRGFAFIRMDSHENAANAICQLSGYNVNGRPLKCSWGKDRPTGGQYDGQTPAQAPATPGGYPQPSPGGFGYSQYGANPMSANPMSANPMSANPMSANPMSANPMSANPMSANSMSGNPMSPYGAGPPMTPQGPMTPHGQMAPHHNPMASQGGQMSPQGAGPPGGMPGYGGYPPQTPTGRGYPPQGQYPPNHNQGYGMPGGNYEQASQAAWTGGQGAPSGYPRHQGGLSNHYAQY